MNKVLRKLFGLAGLIGIILGAHGVYIHFTRMTTYSIEEIMQGFPSQNKLFTFIPVGPGGDIIRWMSDLGFESWFLPVIIGVIGFLVFRYRRKLSYMIQGREWGHKYQYERYRRSKAENRHR